MASNRCAATPLWASTSAAMSLAGPPPMMATSQEIAETAEVAGAEDGAWDTREAFGSTSRRWQEQCGSEQGTLPGAWHRWRRLAAPGTGSGRRCGQRGHIHHRSAGAGVCPKAAAGFGPTHHHHAPIAREERGMHHLAGHQHRHGLAVAAAAPPRACWRWGCVALCSPAPTSPPGRHRPARRGAAPAGQCAGSGPGKCSGASLMAVWISAASHARRPRPPEWPAPCGRPARRRRG